MQTEAAGGAGSEAATVSAVQTPVGAGPRPLRAAAGADTPCPRGAGPARPHGRLEPRAEPLSERGDGAGPAARKCCAERRRGFPRAVEPAAGPAGSRRAGARRCPPRTAAPRRRPWRPAVASSTARCSAGPGAAG